MKDAELARRNREDGNAAFQSGNHELALVLYTEAMRYSPVHPTTHEGEDFAAAAANRSATLMALGKYEECLDDVQLAIEAGYAAAAAYKLYIRQDRWQIWALSFTYSYTNFLSVPLKQHKLVVIWLNQRKRISRPQIIIG